MSGIVKFSQIRQVSDIKLLFWSEQPKILQKCSFYMFQWSSKSRGFSFSVLSSAWDHDNLRSVRLSNLILNTNLSELLKNGIVYTEPVKQARSRFLLKYYFWWLKLHGVFGKYILQIRSCVTQRNLATSCNIKYDLGGYFAAGKFP